MSGPDLNERSQQPDQVSRSMSLYQNFIPISLLAVVVPVIVMGFGAYFSSQANEDKIEILRQDREKFDFRISDKMSRLDDKINKIAILLERTSTTVDSIKDDVREIAEEQKRQNSKVYNEK